MFRYIHWAEQNFPKGGREGHIIDLLKQCAKLFKDDQRYKNDERYIKIWIKFVSIYNFVTYFAWVKIINTYKQIPVFT